MIFVVFIRDVHIKERVVEGTQQTELHFLDRQKSYDDHRRTSGLNMTEIMDIVNMIKTAIFYFLDRQTEITMASQNGMISKTTMKTRSTAQEVQNRVISKSIAVRYWLKTQNMRKIS